jgi:MFS family permease
MFGLALIPGILAVIAVVWFVQETVDHATTSPKFAFSFKQFDGHFIRYISILFLFTLGNSSDMFLLFRVEETVRHSGALHSFIAGIPMLGDMVRRVGDGQVQAQLVNILFLPLVWAFFHIIKVVLSTPLGALSDRIGRKIVISIGWGIYAFVYLSFALLDRLEGNWQIICTFVLFAIYALYYAFTEGAEKAFVADLVTPETRGSAFGMYNFAAGLGALPASIAFGFLYNSFGATVAFGTGAGIAFVSMLLLALTVTERPQHATR